jgi:hypothetical protein
MSTEINENVRKILIGNILLRGLLFQKKRREKMRKTQQIPSMILLDSTSACNLECIGCWAKNYSRSDSLSYELMDRIIEGGKKSSLYHGFLERR